MSKKYIDESYYFQYSLLGEIYAYGAKKVGKFNFPEIKPVNIIPDAPVLSINYLLSCSNIENYWFHCFCDDYQFERLWNNFYKYLPLLKKARGIITTDFSLYRDYPNDLLIWNTYRNRVMAYAIQNVNCNTIPTATFGDENTWSWCFDSLPQNSSVAITTNGTLKDPEAKRLFVGGVNELKKVVHPSTIIVCGRVPSWLDIKFSDTKIVHISSYGQVWNARRNK